MKICPLNGTSLFSVHLFQDFERLFQCIISIIVLRNDRNVCFQERVACLTFKRGKFTIQFDCSDWIHYSPVARVRPHFRCLFLPCCNFRLLFFFLAGSVGVCLRPPFASSDMRYCKQCIRYWCCRIQVNKGQMKYRRGQFFFFINLSFRQKKSLIYWEVENVEVTSF